MKLSKYHSLFIILTIFLAQIGQISLAHAVSSFSDISTYKYRQSIEELMRRGVVQGYADRTFKPEQQINRAEFLKIILESKKLSFDTTQKNCFTDVKEKWFEKYICFALSQKLIEGYPDGLFRPEKNINYVEALKILYKSYGKQGKVDAKAYWFSHYFEDIKEKEIALEELGNKYDHLLTRGEMTELLVRFLKVYDPQNVIQIPGTYLQYIFPPNYTAQLGDSEFRPGYFLSYDLKPKIVSSPSFHSIAFFSEDSINEFNQKCSIILKEGGLCFEGNYYTPEVYKGLKEAFLNKKAYKDYEVEIIGKGYFLVSNEKCVGDECFFRHYVSFIDDLMIDVSIVMNDDSQISQSESDFLFIDLHQTSSDIYPFNNFSLVYPEQWQATYFDRNTFNMVSLHPKNSDKILYLQRQITQSPQEAQQFIDQKLEHLKQTNFTTSVKIPITFDIEGTQTDGVMVSSVNKHASLYDPKEITALEILTYAIKDNTAYFFITHIDPETNEDSTKMVNIIKYFKVL